MWPCPFALNGGHRLRSLRRLIIHAPIDFVDLAVSSSVGCSGRTDDLLDAARWSNLQGSLVTHGVRGLGGGLEYAIASDCCTTLILQIVDSPSCNKLKGVIQEKLDGWSEGHLVLHFVNETNAVGAELPPEGSAEPWRGYGAEIDIFAKDPKEYPKVERSGAFFPARSAPIAA